MEERHQRLKQTIQAFEIEKSQHEQLTIHNANTISELKSLKESFHHKELFLNEQVALKFIIFTVEEKLRNLHFFNVPLFIFLFHVLFYFNR